jgi:hypothetical protein
MTNGTRQLGVGGIMAALLLTGVPALAGPKLHLGRPRVIAGGTVAVPVKLKARRTDDVAALNFTLRYDPAGPVTALRDGVTDGNAVRRARAEVASATDAGQGTVRVLAIPEFRENFATLRNGCVAWVDLWLREPVPPGRLGRWIRRHVRIEEVVLGSSQGREIVQETRRGSR